jgi:hypothetical protein
MQSLIDPGSVSPKPVATTGSPASAEIADMTKVAASGSIAGRLRDIAAGFMPSGARRNQAPTSPPPFKPTVGMEKVTNPVRFLGGLKTFLDRVMTTDRSERHGVLLLSDIDRLLSAISIQSREDTALLMRAMLLKDLTSDGQTSHVKSRQPQNSEAIQKLLLQDGLNWVDKKQLGISVVEGGQQKDLIPILSQFGYGKNSELFSESLSELISAGKDSSSLGGALKAHFDSKTPKGGNTSIICDDFVPAPSFHRDENSDNAYLLSLHIIKNSSGEYSIELDCPPDRRLSTQYIPHSECFMPSMNPKNEAAIIKNLGVRDSAELKRVITDTNRLWQQGTTHELSELADNHCSSAALGTIIKQPSRVIHRSPSRKTIANVQEYMKQNKVTVYRVLLLKFCKAIP